MVRKRCLARKNAVGWHEIDFLLYLYIMIKNKKIYMLSRAALTLMFMCCLIAVPLYAETEAYVIRVYYPHVSNVNALVKYDLHESGSAKDKYVRMTATDEICKQLAKDGWKYEVDTVATRAMQSAAMNFYGGYRTVDEIYEDCNTVTAAFPHITEIVEYGDAWCKWNGGYITRGGDTQKTYRLKAVRVHNKEKTNSAPVFFLMASIHAREITTPEIAMRMLDWLTQGYGVNADATWIVNEVDTWIVPIVNPEGRWIVELGTQPPYSGQPFSQRKNAHPDGCSNWEPTSWSQYGIDLNRNHSFKWNTVGSSSTPCDMLFHGSAPASEQEVFHLQALITNLIADQRGPTITSIAPSTAEGLFISLHSYGDLVLWPWGHTYTAAPNASGLRTIGERFAGYNNYTAQQASDLYPTGGDSVEWVYGELGVPAYTFELGSGGEGFMPPFSVVDSSQWPENKDALIYAAKICRLPYQYAYGPDVHSIFSVDMTNSTIKITAVVDVGVRTGDTIAAAEMCVDGLPWDADAVAYTMTAVDGVFDGHTETVEVIYTVRAHDPVRMPVYIRGQGTNGMWGPVSSAFVIVPEPGFFFVFGCIAFTASRNALRARRYV